MAFAESLDVFTADFGVAATLNGAAVRAIVDNGYVEIMGLASRNPTGTLTTAEAGSAVQGAAFVVGATTYRVTSVQHDGTGMTTLGLEMQLEQ